VVGALVVEGSVLVEGYVEYLEGDGLFSVALVEELFSEFVFVVVDEGGGE